jgi:hypothetical protein
LCWRLLRPADGAGEPVPAHPFARPRLVAALAHDVLPEGDPKRFGDACQGGFSNFSSEDSQMRPLGDAPA